MKFMRKHNHSVSPETLNGGYNIYFKTMTSIMTDDVYCFLVFKQQKSSVQRIIKHIR